MPLGPSLGKGVGTFVEVVLAPWAPLQNGELGARSPPWTLHPAEAWVEKTRELPRG